LGEPDTKVYCCKFDLEDKYIACACENGQVRVFNVNTGKMSYVIYSSRPNVPFSYVKWRPQAPQFKTRNIFVTANTEGELQHYHLTSGKCLGTIKDDSFDPQLYCIDYNQDATKIAVCGSEPVIKIYDEEKRCLDFKLGGEQTIPPGHSSRVYTVKFDKEDPRILLTGGWDYRVILWDLRDRKPAQGIYGPLICGDGIDLHEGNILTSSWTQTN
jgi:WD40 repeat protein